MRIDIKSLQAICVCIIIMAAIIYENKLISFQACEKVSLCEWHDQRMIICFYDNWF